MTKLTAEYIPKIAVLLGSISFIFPSPIY